MLHEKLTSMTRKTANDIDFILRRINGAESPIAVYIVDGLVRATYYTLGLVKMANAGEVQMIGVYMDGATVEADVSAALTNLRTRPVAGFGLPDEDRP